MVKCYKSVYELGVIDALWCVIGFFTHIIVILTPVIEGLNHIIETLKHSMGANKCVIGIL